MPESAEIAREQQYVSMLYERLDDARVDARTQLREIVLGETTGTDQGMTERDSLALHYQARIDQLDAVERGLCFGRLDRVAAEMLYIGRMGLADDDRNTLLVDWRAPAAQPFYQATAAAPAGVSRRRQLRTKDRTVIGIDDDLLDAGGLADDEVTLAGEAALLASLRAGRTGRLGDIVVTIQAEQDRAIRTDLPGILVVQGGPGTGKTVVALHRVAYLLYTHRDRLARRGVLVVGPNPGFLDYVSAVLPALGETDIVFTTPGDLLPGVRTAIRDNPETARVKGGEAMVAVLEAAVLDRQELPEAPMEIPLDDVTVWLESDVASAARDAARDSRLVHNQARAVFAHHVIEMLTTRAVGQIGAGWLHPEQPDVIAEEVIDQFGEPIEDDGLAEHLTENVRAELAGSTALAEALDLLWPMLTPQRLLADLLSSVERLEVAAAGLPPANRDALYRELGDAWTVSDVPLLDEAVDMLGSDGTDIVAVDPEDDEDIDPLTLEHVDYAEGELEILDTEEDPDEEVLRAVDLMAADQLAERQEELDLRGLAERAAADRNWTYGHIVVDEAQELPGQVDDHRG